MRKVFEAEDASFFVDEENAIFHFTWKNTLTEESVKKVLTIASRAVHILPHVNWFIDRRSLEEYSTEARIWFKTDFLQKVGLELIEKTVKIATVNSHHPMAQVSGNILIDAIIQINPKVEHASYDVPQPAMNWLLGKTNEAEAEPEKKKKGFFRRK